MPDNQVPDVPTDWAARESEGTPYVLTGLAHPEWRATLVLPIVIVATQTVTAANGRAVYTLPG